MTSLQYYLRMDVHIEYTYILSTGATNKKETSERNIW